MKDYFIGKLCIVNNDGKKVIGDFKSTNIWEIVTNNQFDECVDVIFSINGTFKKNKYCYGTELLTGLKFPIIDYDKFLIPELYDLVYGKLRKPYFVNSVNLSDYYSFTPIAYPEMQREYLINHLDPESISFFKWKEELLKYIKQAEENYRNLPTVKEPIFDFGFDYNDAKSRIRSLK